MEAAVKWMYSVDAELVMPYQDNLISLINTDEFRDIVDDNLLRRMDFIRKTGNIAAHAGKKISKEQAALCLENLYIFFDFVAYCYAEEYQEGAFDPSLLEKEPPVAVPAINPDAELKLEKLIAENAALKEELTARRVEQQQTYVPNRWISLSTRLASSISMQCWKMLAGSKERTGSMSMRFRECLTNPK
jgi:type I restriction enzyme R subunit